MMTPCAFLILTTFIPCRGKTTKTPPPQNAPPSAYGRPYGPPAYGQAPPPAYGQPLPPAYGQAPYAQQPYAPPPPPAQQPYAAPPPPAPAQAPAPMPGRPLLGPLVGPLAWPADAPA